MSHEEYQHIHGCNWSLLKHARTSMLHFRHAELNPPEDTTRFGLGRAAHTAILEPHRFEEEYAIFEGAVRRGKAWDAFAEANASKTILKADEWQTVENVAKAVRAYAPAMECLRLGDAMIERAISWMDETGVRCKARPDVVHSATVEVKTANTIDERQFRAQAHKLGYFGQLAFYRRGVESLTGMRLPCVFVAVEMDAPHDVAVFTVDELTLQVADAEITRLLTRVAECRKTNVWPGRYASPVSIGAPDWALRDDNYEEAA